MKLCIHCRHYGQNVPPPLRSDDRPMIRQPGSGLLCLHPSTSEGVSLTTGESIRYASTASAEYQRSIPHLIATWTGACGSRGRHFEHKDPE
ncbi:hypothetical protein [Burkholderia multivorans]|uniref:hypothetical protein n=1 Tax=Burkholderia multivorans TaxID=87883 RepID=UPI00143E1770|nr:hypothetical protein [Burkholderia multivorans]QIX18362.1 hypothetical protein FOB32_22835 [Burkholderia multivorans]